MTRPLLSLPLVLLLAAPRAAPGQETKPPPAAAKPEEAKKPEPAEVEKKAEPKPGFESIIPASAIFFLGVDDMPALLQSWRDSPFGRFLADPAAAPVVNAFDHLMKSALAANGESSDPDLVSDSQKMVKGRMGVAGLHSDTEHGEGEFTICGAGDMGEHASEYLERTVKVAAHAGGGEEAVRKTESEGDVEVTVLLKKIGETTRDMRFASQHGVVVSTSGATSESSASAMRGLLASLESKGGESLATRPDFKSSVAAEPAGVRLFIDLAAIVSAERRALAARLKEEGQEAPPMTDVAIGPLAARLSFERTGLNGLAHLSWGGDPSTGKLVAAWMRSADYSLVKLIAPGVRGAIALHVDLAAGLAATDAMLKENGQGPLFEEPPPVDGADGGAAATTPMVDVKKTLLEHVDGRLALEIANVDESEAFPFGPSGAPIAVNAALVVGVKDAEGLRAGVDKLLRARGLHAARKHAEFQGFTVYSVPIAPITIHYAILDDVAVVSMSQTLLQDVLRRKGDTELKSLAADPAFVNVTRGFDPGDSLLLYTPTPSELAPSIASTAAELAMYAEMAMSSGSDGPNPSAASAVQATLELLTSLAKIEPAVYAKYLPSGVALGIGGNAQGLRFDVAAR